MTHRYKFHKYPEKIQMSLMKYGFKTPSFLLHHKVFKNYNLN